MERSLSRTKMSWGHLRQLLVPRPYTGRLGLDLAYLLVIGALHHTILPSIFGRVVLIDLMTPWLVTSFVAAPLAESALLAFFGALILETHSAAPAGLYMTAYWVIAVVLKLSRSTLSWRHIFPWAVTFLMAQIWVIAFETFVTWVNEGGFVLDLKYGMTQGLRVLTSLILGLLLCQRIVSQGPGEEVS